MSFKIYFELPSKLSPDQVKIYINKTLLTRLRTELYLHRQLLAYEVPGFLGAEIELYVLTNHTTGIIRIYFVSEAKQNSFVEIINLRKTNEVALNVNLKQLLEGNGIRSGRGRGGKNIVIKQAHGNLPKPDFDFYKNQTPPGDLLSHIKNEDKNALIEVFYATDRNRINRRDGKVAYGRRRGILQLGSCVVNVPANKKKGALPTPPWYYFGFSASEDKYMLIKETELLTPELFFSRLSSKVQNSEDKDAFVFVHGFNVSFKESVLRAAQIAKDISFQGAPIVYSWPSRSSAAKYSADEATNTGYSIAGLCRLLRDVCTTTGAQKVHLIAHSMGSRCLTEALQALEREHFNEEFQFNQIILAAPDLDAEVFVKEIAPRIVQCSKRVTLYASKKDIPLLYSGKLLHGGIMRAGKITNRIAVVEGMDTVNATRETIGLLGHGYFAESKALIDDIHSTTHLNLSPKERNLRRREAGEKVYWEFW